MIRITLIDESVFPCSQVATTEKRVWPTVRQQSVVKQFAVWGKLCADHDLGLRPQKGLDFARLDVNAENPRATLLVLSRGDDPAAVGRPAYCEKEVKPEATSRSTPVSIERIAIVPRPRR